MVSWPPVCDAKEAIFTPENFMMQFKGLNKGEHSLKKKCPDNFKNYKKGCSYDRRQ
jgi:hypothetical protein